MKATCSHCSHDYSLHGCLSEICPICGAPPRRTQEGQVELVNEVFLHHVKVLALQQSNEEMQLPLVANG
jgi:hypothetical protein